MPADTEPGPAEERTEKPPRQRCLCPPEERTGKNPRQRCPGPPEKRTEDGAVLSGRSEKEKKHVSDVSFHFFPGGSGSGVGLTSRDRLFPACETCTIPKPYWNRHVL